MNTVREEMVMIPLTGLTRHICLTIPNHDLDFQSHVSWCVCVQWVQLRWEMNVCFT